VGLGFARIYLGNTGMRIRAADKGHGDSFWQGQIINILRLA